MLRDIVILARPYQYTKNFLIFLPAFFDSRLDELDVVWNIFITFVAFCLVSSAAYILNDWKDRDEDRRHPVKSKRPIASGSINNYTVFILIVLFLIGGGMLALYSSFQVFLLIGLYFTLNLAYSFKLKHISIIDISLISIGFVIRIFAGAEAAGVQLSHWIIVITFLLALFLSLAKRRDDVLIFINSEHKVRRVIDGYNIKFLDSAMVMSASIVVLAYVLWSITPEVASRLSTDNLYLTSVFVIIGVMRYMQIAFVKQDSGDPSKVFLKDRFMQLIVLCWFGVFVWMFYF